MLLLFGLELLYSHVYDGCVFVFQEISAGSELLVFYGLEVRHSKSLFIKANLRIRVQVQQYVNPQTERYRQ